MKDESDIQSSSFILPVQSQPILQVQHVDLRQPPRHLLCAGRQIVFQPPPDHPQRRTDHAIEKFLRFDGPVETSTMRFAREEILFRGQRSGSRSGAVRAAQRSGHHAADQRASGVRAWHSLLSGRADRVNGRPDRDQHAAATLSRSAAGCGAGEAALPAQHIDPWPGEVARHELKPDRLARDAVHLVCCGA